MHSVGSGVTEKWWSEMFWSCDRSAWVTGNVTSILSDRCPSYFNVNTSHLSQICVPFSKTFQHCLHLQNPLPLPVPHLFPSQLWPPCSVWLTPPAPPPSPSNHLPLQDQNTLFLFIYPAAVSVVSGSVHRNVEGHAIRGKSLKLPVLVVTNIHTINK